MPILKPDIQAALRASGLSPSETDEKPLLANLEDAGLSQDAVLKNLGFIMENGGSDAIRLRAIENALKVRGLMKDSAAPAPQISITIVDALPKVAESVEGVNRILLPRELLKERVQ